jgi:hypothetical protein
MQCVRKRLLWKQYIASRFQKDCIGPLDIALKQCLRGFSRLHKNTQNFLLAQSHWLASLAKKSKNRLKKIALDCFQEKKRSLWKQSLGDCITRIPPPPPLENPMGTRPGWRRILRYEQKIAPRKD